jgi:MFS family permease
MKSLREPGGTARTLHPAFKMLFACCAIQFGGLGVLSNSIGVFFPYVCSEFGFSTAQITLHITIRGFATMAALPLAGRLISRYRSRYVLMPAAVLLVLSIGSMASFDRLWQWYLASVFYGIAGAFLFLNMSPILLTNWFTDRTGFAIGVAMAFSGLGGIVMNPVGNAIIQAFGWRIGYLAFAAIGAVFLLPFIAFVLERSPEDIGAVPYSVVQKAAATAMEAENTGRTAPRAPAGIWRNGVFWVFALIVLLTAYETVYMYHFPGYTFSVGLGTMIGSSMSSASMAGNLAGKLYLGWLNDRLSAKKVFLIGTGLTAVGIGLIQLFGSSAPILLLGSFLYGTCMALTVVMVPLLILELFDRRSYPAVLSAASMLTSAIGGVGTALVGLIYDISGGYGISFMIAQIGCILSIVLIFTVYRLKTTKRFYKKGLSCH